MPRPFFEPRNKKTGKYPTHRKKTSSVETVQTTLSNPGKRPELSIPKKYDILSIK
ncbi:hypothetical protein KAU33_09345 [Candidatus Dependentiae bacterium]|nr:hypothetical protein [Candidatus Dependentiae bacterium]